MSWLGDQAFRPLKGRNGEGLLPANLMRVEVEPYLPGHAKAVVRSKVQYHINYYTTE